MRKSFVVTCAALCGLGCSLIEEAGDGSCGESGPAPEIGDWDEAAIAFEARVLALTNAERARGGCCGSKGCFAASRALVPNDNLTVAARRHAKDMSDRNYFSHQSLDGRGLRERLAAVRFQGCAAGENIAQGYSTPEKVVAGWMKSDGHCANMLSNAYDSLGVGYYDDPEAELRQFWVQNFGG